jgi:hypothetical protein
MPVIQCDRIGADQPRPDKIRLKSETYQLGW